MKDGSRGNSPKALFFIRARLPAAAAAHRGSAPCLHVETSRRFCEIQCCLRLHQTEGTSIFARVSHLLKRKLLSSRAALPFCVRLRPVPKKHIHSCCASYFRTKMSRMGSVRLRAVRGVKSENRGGFLSPNRGDICARLLL